MNKTIRGYAEGYYGRLLAWTERLEILESLHQHGMNTYYYAPKEDRCHRWQWRLPYDRHWCANFSNFCDNARKRQVRVIAGVAPGIDFDFRHLNGGSDFDRLLEKCRVLLDCGADGISLLMDDIDADFHTRDAGIASEGVAHARLANTLAKALFTEQCNTIKWQRDGNDSLSLWVTPRIYADELDALEPHYLPDFLGELDAQHFVLYCGPDIVSRQLDETGSGLIRRHSNHRVIVWDNLYANDYCPRRLFIGPWLGRSEVDDILLNPTGMIRTDLLLLDMMASFSAPNSPDNLHDLVLKRHGVPKDFGSLTAYFYHPVFNDMSDLQIVPQKDISAALDALEICLWRWKTPLSREWYPYLFGLKHDLLIHSKDLADMRIRKTQNLPLVNHLLVNRD